MLASKPGDEPASGAGEEAAGSPSPVLLVVEDDANTLALYTRILESRRFEVIGAQTGSEAIQTAERVAPDLILLDLMLPDLSGLEVCRRLRKIPSLAFTPILVISGKAERQVVLESLSGGADDFLRKPVEPDELLARVEAHLRGKVMRERYARVFSALPTPLLIVGREGKILAVNQAAERLLGSGGEELVGSSLTGWIAAEGASGVADELEKVRGGAAPTGFPVQVRVSASGETEKRLFSAARLWGAEGEVLVFLAGRGGEPLEDLPQAMVADSVLAMVAADLHGVIRVFNEAAEHLSGYQASGVIGKMNIADFYAGGVAQDIMKRLRSGLYGGPGLLEPTVNAIRSATGDEIPVKLSASILYDRAGNEVATMGIFEDMRERIAIDRAIAKTREQTEAKQRKDAVSALAGAAAHELNQPLTAIMGSAQLLQQQAAMDATVQRHVARILSETQRITDTLKGLSKVDVSDTRQYAGKTSILNLAAGEGRGEPDANLTDLLAEISKFSEELSGSITPDALVAEFSKIVEEIFPEASFFLGVHRGKACEVMAASHALGKLLGKTFASNRIKRHVTRRSRENRLVTDFANLSPFAPQDPSCKAVLVVPLWALRHEVGLVWFELDDPARATGERIELVRLLGSQFATAYRNFVLFERTGYLEGYVEGLIRHTNAAVLVLSSDRRVKIANRVMEELLGATEGEVVGSDFFDFVVVDERYEHWKAAFEKALEGEAVAGEAIDIISRDGTVRHLIVNATRVPGAPGGGEESDILFVGLDVTEATGLRDQLAQREKLASLGEMAAGIAHEFNSPLTVLNSAAELLARGAERLGAAGEDLRNPMNFLRESMDRVQGLARNLLSFARPSAKEAKFPLHLNAEVERALSFSRYELSRGGVKIKTELGADLPQVLGVSNEIQQVFINLLNNARQAMAPKGGVITVTSAKGADGWAEVRVKDEGRGIPPELEAKIFQPFVTTKVEGSGLGLYIVRGILDNHGATIGVSSSKNGTTFVLRFPPYWK